MVEWREIEGSNGRYSVSECGKVYANELGREIGQYYNDYGYLRTALTINGVRKNHYIHRLVAKEFCEGYKEGLEVNHIDASRTNNHKDNLEWVTRKENIDDMFRRGTHTIAEAQATLRRPVKRFSMEGEFLSEYASIREAVEKYSVDQGSLSKVCLGQRGSAGGFKWEYVEEK